ncbi:sialidase family protein, partial [Acinetobacter baumannii]|uniref:sialidase family protein n=1 Tax=Acinetobacter baumannii TaxID=470 RepID=UPI0033336CEF
WSAPRTIAEGGDWFVNWADTPHIAATADGALWAHWLQKSAAATYAYDVVLARSADGGASWSAPLRVNDDGTPTEHGFV